MTKISVVLVTYNSDATLAKCLTHLEQQTYRDFEVLIVDNGGTSRLDELASQLSVPTRILRPGKNLGFAGGMNFAARAVGDDTQWLAMLNADAYAGAHWLENFLRATQLYPHCAMFASLQRMANNPKLSDGLGIAYHAGGLAWRIARGWPLPEQIEDNEVFAPCGAAGFFRMDRWHAIGGMDDDFFCFYEETDIAFRLRLQGDYCLMLAHSAVMHVGGASTTDAPEKASDFVVYHSTRNMVWCFIKNMPGILLPLLLPLHIAVSLTQGARMAMRGHGGAVWRGWRDAWRGIKPILAKRKVIQANRKIGAMEILQSLNWQFASRWKLKVKSIEKASTR
jgi:N-acetylglucosaminyl-diphospho-decaprenol L-rhamnosyltransferase